MKKLICKIYEWYDAKNEPLRFILFFVPSMLLIMGASGNSLALSIVCALVLGFALISRLLYFHWDDLKKMAKGKKKNEKDT